MMGLVSALVYLLALITFLPFAFKRDIVEATSGGGNKDVVYELDQVETGRFLHRFPLTKVSPTNDLPSSIAEICYSLLRMDLLMALSPLSSSLASSMIRSICDGGTSFSSLHSLHCLPLDYTLSTLVLLTLLFPWHCDHILEI